jgi:hypothetical protein
MSRAWLRRRGIGVALIAVVIAAGACSTRQNADAIPSASPSPTGTPAFVWPSGALASVPPVDVVVGDQLWLAAGGRVSLSYAGQFPAVTRTSAGLLVFGAAEETGDVYLLGTDGTPTKLLSSVGFVALSWDRLAYRSGTDRIIVAEVSGDKLVTVAQTDGVGDLGPNLIVGDAIYLSMTETGGGPDRYDVWFPARGPFKPTPGLPSVLIAGSMPGGKTLVGFAGADNCLAELAPDTLKTIRTACELPLAPTWLMPASPDGRYLLGIPLTEKDAAFGIALVDLATVFDRQEFAAVWPVPDNRTVLIDSCVWPDVKTAVCGASDGYLARLRVDVPGTVDWLELHGVPKEPGSDVAVPVLPVRTARE